MLQLHIQTTLPLAKPTTADIVSQSFVTWWDVNVIDRDDTTGGTTRIARARFAVVHVEEMYEQGYTADEVLPDQGLDVLLPHFNEVDENLSLAKDEDFRQDILYLSCFEIDSTAGSKDLDVAVVQRVYDTLCTECRFVLVPDDESDRPRWRQHGFYVRTPKPASSACLYWDTSNWRAPARIHGPIHFDGAVQEAGHVQR